MRLLTVFLILLLVLTACAVPDADVPVSSDPANTTQRVPTSVPAKPTATAKPESRIPAADATFETSLLAVEWRNDTEGNLLFPLDPASGAALGGYEPISLQRGFSYALSLDRRTLAAVTFPNDFAYNGSLLLIDLPAWESQQLDLKLDGWARSVVFSPDGTRLAIAHGETTSKVTMIDVENGVILAWAETEPFVTRMKFTLGGEALMLYGQVIKNRFTESEMSGGPSQVLLLDAQDLSPRWSVELEAVREGIFPMNENVSPENMHEPGQALYLSPGLVFAPDRDLLYVVHADSDHLTTVEFGNQKVETVEIQAKLSWFERFLALTAGVAHAKIADGTSKQVAVSPDGQFLYVIGSTITSYKDTQGNWQMKQTPLGLEIIQTSDGSRVERFETDAFELSLSPDGRFLYLRGWAEDAPWTEIFDTSNQQFVTRKEWISAFPALRMNGESLLVSTYSTGEFSHHMSVLEPDDLGLLTDWSGPDYLAWLTTP